MEIENGNKAKHILYAWDPPILSDELRKLSDGRWKLINPNTT